MKNLLYTVLFSLIFFSCEKNQLRVEPEYVARIAGFDPNCSVCILEFPDDASTVKKNLGESPDNYYLAANLSREDFKPGQKIKVSIRKATAGELGSCNLQNSNGYTNIIVTNVEAFSDLSLNDSIELSYRDCRFEPDNNFYICLDSVLNDSRCPNGAYCFWEGNAVARFRFEKMNNEPVFFDLNTHRGFRTDTTINGFNFHLIGLNPHPSIENRIPQNEYKAVISVEKQK